MSVRVFAPAKINLTLEVGRPRADGMHPLQSVVVFADVGDVVETAPADTLSLTITGEFAEGLSPGEDNLVLRAARALAAHAGAEQGAALTLEKNLPIASGIGGGSADAAATLRALNALWSLNLDAAELARIGASLGADVPVCLSGAPAYMSGIGEQVEPIAAPPLHAVLINPVQSLLTPDVYRTFDKLDLDAAFTSRPAPRWRSASDALAGITSIGNHLEAPAITLMPVIGEMLAIVKADARVRAAAMSGSGATVFAITDAAETAAALADELQTQHPTWWVTDTLLGGA